MCIKFLNFHVSMLFFRVLTITNNEYQVTYSTDSSSNALTADKISLISKVPLNEKLKIQWEGEKSHINRQ